MLHLRSTLMLALVLAPALVASNASADKCKGPKVVIKNDKAKTIKVTKIQYYDGCDKKWRTENVSLRELSSGEQTTITDDLEYVGNCSVSKFKLYRAVRKNTGTAYGDYVWGGELVPEAGAKVCNSGVTYTIHAHD